MLNFFDANSDDSDDYQSLCSSAESTSGSDSFASLPSLCDHLSSQFSDVPKNFNVIHINAQSIPAHFPEMLTSFNDNNIHAILVSESWLKPCLPSNAYSLPGFRLIRNDRTGSRGGGVAIYLRSHFPFKVINTSAQPPPLQAGEHLFLEVTLSHTKVLLGVYYSHSYRVNFFPSFENILEKLVPSYSHCIIMGDFNTCLLKKDSRAASMESLVKSCNLHILPLSATHHVPNKEPSLLDLIIVSSFDHTVKHGQCSADFFSYHDLIFLSYKIRPPKAKPKVILQRSFGGMDQVKFLEDADNQDWTSVLNASTMDDKVNCFNSIITRLFDIHAPFRLIKLKHTPAPWLTDEIKTLIHRKSVANTKYKTVPSEYNKAKYYDSRNRCNRVCRDAQRRHIHESVSDEDPAKVWKFLRSLGVGKSRQDTVPGDLDINSLNQHFSSTSCISDLGKANTLNHLSSLPIPDHSLFLFSQVTAVEVKKSILSISSNAVGVDGISRNMLIPILDIILPILCHLFNYSLSNGSFPSIWKEAQVIPLPKKSNPKSFSEYRPISILPFLSKVLERIVHNQLNSYLSLHNLLNPMQSGFRKGHSTVTALVKITDDIRLGMEHGQLTVLTLLDFSNAFNTVDFDILLALLRSLNISTAVTNWFSNYLFGRRQRVRFEESVSSWCDLSAGVPQGGVLSPLLFAIFINSISQNLSSFYHLYADDLQLYTQEPLSNIADAVMRTNSDLRLISEWSRAHGLRINPSKTQTIIIGSSRTLCKLDWSALPQVSFDGIVIPYSETVKNLGITMDRNLSWRAQLDTTSRKLFASAGSLRRLRNFLPTSTKTVLAQSLLLPVLDYADACYLDLTEEQLNKLERLQNFCIKFIFGLRKYDHVSPFRSLLKWLPIRLRRNTHILCLLYSVLFNPFSPRYLKDRFEYLHSLNSRSLRSSENLLLKTPGHCSSFYDDSFTVQAVRLWNALPVEIRRATSLDIFKSKLKHHYLSSIST